MNDLFFCFKYLFLDLFQFFGGFFIFLAIFIAIFDLLIKKD